MVSEFGAETVYGAFSRSAERWPENDFLAVPSMPGRGYHEAGIAFTYAEIQLEVERLKQRYAAAGYGSGHRVALLVG